MREGLIQHLPAYKRPDVYGRGERVEDAAFFHLHELEEALGFWDSALEVVVMGVVSAVELTTLARPAPPGNDAALTRWPRHSGQTSGRASITSRKLACPAVCDPRERADAGPRRLPPLSSGGWRAYVRHQLACSAPVSTTSAEPLANYSGAGMMTPAPQKLSWELWSVQARISESFSCVKRRLVSIAGPPLLRSSGAVPGQPKGENP